MDSDNHDDKEGWSIYEDPETFHVSAGDEGGGYVQVTLERNPDWDIELGSYEDEDLTEKRLFKVNLLLNMEELPRLIIILNEIYRRHYEKVIPHILCDEERLSGDNEDRVAALRDYQFVANLLCEHANRLGLFSPLE